MRELSQLWLLAISVEKRKHDWNYHLPFISAQYAHAKRDIYIYIYIYIDWLIDIGSLKWRDGKIMWEGDYFYSDICYPLLSSLSRSISHTYWHLLSLCVCLSLSPSSPSERKVYAHSPHLLPVVLETGHGYEVCVDWVYLSQDATYQ